MLLYCQSLSPTRNSIYSLHYTYYSIDLAFRIGNIIIPSRLIPRYDILIILSRMFVLATLFLVVFLFPHANAKPTALLIAPSASLIPSYYD